MILSQPLIATLIRVPGKRRHRDAVATKLLKGVTLGGGKEQNRSRAQESESHSVHWAVP